MPDIDNIAMTIEELALDGAVSLGRCSRSTLYRYRKEINRRLEAQHANWRVIAGVADRSLRVVIPPELQQMAGK